jgi:hypothetical protein
MIFLPVGFSEAAYVSPAFCVQDIFFAAPSSSGHTDAKTHEVELLRIMSVGADGNHYTGNHGIVHDIVMNVESLRLCIDFDYGVFFRSFWNSAFQSNGYGFLFPINLPEGYPMQSTNG